MMLRNGVSRFDVAKRGLWTVTQAIDAVGQSLESGIEKSDARVAEVK
jgi:hypothetical protein